MRERRLECLALVWASLFVWGLEAGVGEIKGVSASA